MPTIDLHADALTLTTGDSHLDVIDLSCLSALQALLPPGVAWTRDQDATLTALLTALSYEYSRVKRRGRLLFAELDPLQTLELLEDFERVYGLPGCTTPTTLAGRRLALQARMLGFDSPTATYLVSLAVDLGYADAAITTFSRSSLFTCTSPCNATLYTRAWMFVWTLTATAISTEQDAALACTLEEVSPSHTGFILSLT